MHSPDDRTAHFRDTTGGRRIARLALQLTSDGDNLTVDDPGGRVHLIDIVHDEADKATWLARRGA